MPIIASDKGKTNFPPVPEGQYIAICYAVIDEGEQYSEMFQKTNRKVRLMWEIPEEKIEIDGEMKPRAITKEYTLSLAEKSNLRKDLAGWRGKSFTPQELESFDLRNVLGKACFIQIIHAAREGKPPYANISAIMAVPKGTPVPPPVNELMYLDWEAPEFDETLSKLPEWIQKTVHQSSTWTERQGSGGNGSWDGFVGVPESVDEDDLPF